MSDTSEKPRHSNALPIKNTAFRRFLTFLALKTTVRFYRWDGSCAPLSSRHIIKKGESIDLTEAATMAFIAARTNIPVPRVHCSFVHKKKTYIVMERIRGQTFAEALRTLSEKERDDLFAQLRGMLQELRSLPPPGTGVESCVGGSLCDSRIPRSTPRFGPFSSIREFHRWLRKDLQPEQHPERKNDEDWVEIKKMVAMQDREGWGPPVFTHCDLNPFNIIVRNGKIAAIIDWEMSGWYPSYWEYTSVWHGNKTREIWQEWAPKFIDPCPEELEMERIRQRWWGEI